MKYLILLLELWWFLFSCREGDYLEICMGAQVALYIKYTTVNRKCRHENDSNDNYIHCKD